VVVLVPRLMSFDRETWQVACALVRRHGAKAMFQSAKATEVCLAHQDLDGALTNMWVAKAVMVLLMDKPRRGERVH
jgi:hypothetical protein